MHANFCTTCGARLTRKGWRSWVRGAVCDDCSARSSRLIRSRPLLAIAALGLAAFALGRYLRPPPPPLIIQRAANSPLSDLPINLNSLRSSGTISSQTSSPSFAPTTDDVVYICGARTKKGTPCRRRVHNAGERCYQHKGRPAMVRLERLTIRP